MSRQDILEHTTDKFKGVAITPEALPDASQVDLFEQLLVASLKQWEADGIRGIWLKLSADKGAFIGIANKYGFTFHHAKGSTALMTKWLPKKEESLLPGYATYSLGAAAIIINTKKQILVLKDKYDEKRKWKLPGGAINPNESVAEGVEREVLEETGMRASFYSILAIREATQFRFGHGDLFFICVLQAEDENQELRKQEAEISALEWMKLEDWLALSYNTFVPSIKEALISDVNAIASKAKKNVDDFKSADKVVATSFGKALISNEKKTKTETYYVPRSSITQ